MYVFLEQYILACSAKCGACLCKLAVATIKLLFKEMVVQRSGSSKKRIFSLKRRIAVRLTETTNIFCFCLGEGSNDPFFIILRLQVQKFVRYRIYASPNWIQIVWEIISTNWNNSTIRLKRSDGGRKKFHDISRKMPHITQQNHQMHQIW